MKMLRRFEEEKKKKKGIRGMRTEHFLVCSLFAKERGND